MVWATCFSLPGFLKLKVALDRNETIPFWETSEPSRPTSSKPRRKRGGRSVLATRSVRCKVFSYYYNDASCYNDAWLRTKGKKKKNLQYLGARGRGCDVCAQVCILYATMRVAVWVNNNNFPQTVKEARDACLWLKEAGFPQYVHMFYGKISLVEILQFYCLLLSFFPCIDGQFPINLTQFEVEPDHNFLDQASVDALIRYMACLRGHRLKTLRSVRSLIYSVAVEFESRVRLRTSPAKKTNRRINTLNRCAYLANELKVSINWAKVTLT